MRLMPLKIAYYIQCIDRLASISSIGLNIAKLVQHRLTIARLAIDHIYLSSGRSIVARMPALL